MRKSKPTSITVISPHEVAAEVGKIIPRQTFQQFSFWGQLKAGEQNKLVEEGQAFAEAVEAHGRSALALGQRLKNIKQILEPYDKAFPRFCRRFSFTLRQAYRYIRSYEGLVSLLRDEMAIAALMYRGMNILGTEEKPLGKYTEAYRLLGPPTNPTPEKANEWANQLEQTRKEIVKAKNQRRAAGHAPSQAPAEELIKRSPQDRMRRNFRNIKNDLRRVPAKRRVEWLESLFGMVMTQAGMTSKRSFSPEAIPEDFLQGRGRPSLGETEAA